MSLSDRRWGEHIEGIEAEKNHTECEIYIVNTSDLKKINDCQKNTLRTGEKYGQVGSPSRKCNDFVVERSICH